MYFCSLYFRLKQLCPISESAPTTSCSLLTVAAMSGTAGLPAYCIAALLQLQQQVNEYIILQGCTFLRYTFITPYHILRYLHHFVMYRNAANVLVYLYGLESLHITHCTMTILDTCQRQTTDISYFDNC